jgi:putative FmdB family regulatory protein
MPVYEYACEKCGHEFERQQRITEDPVKTCPACRARKVRRLISRTAFVLKGSGWYSDLYSSAKPKDAGAEKPAEASSESKPDSKSEAKPESKPKSDGKPGGESGAKPSRKPKATKAA